MVEIQRACTQSVARSQDTSFRAPQVLVHPDNLDEFFRVRVGALLDQSLLEHYLENDVHHEELLNIMDWIANFEPQVNHAYHTLEKDLEAADIKLVNIKQLSKIEENQLKY